MQDILLFLSHHSLLTMGIIVVFILLLITEFLRAKQGSFRLTPSQAAQLINHQNAVVIDLRPLDAYRSGHIIDAISIPARDIQANTKKLEKFKNKPLLLVCPTGIESQKVAAALLKQGYTVYILAGGIRAWNEADMPLIKE